MLPDLRAAVRPGKEPDDAVHTETEIGQKSQEPMCSDVLLMTRKFCLVMTQFSLSVPTNAARDRKDF